MSDHPLIKAEQIGRISAVAGWLGVLIIAILSVVPGNLRPHTVFPGPLEHTLAYALTGAALAFGYHRIDFRLLCLVGLSAGSVVFEILQAFVPGRFPSALDAVAGSSGVALGMLLGAALWKLFAPMQRQ